MNSCLGSLSMVKIMEGNPQSFVVIISIRYTQYLGRSIIRVVVATLNTLSLMSKTCNESQPVNRRPQLMKLWQVTRGVLYNFTLCNISSSKKFTGRSAAEFTPCSFLHTGQSLLPLWIYCFSYEIKDKAWSKFSIHYHHMIFLLEVAKLLMLSSIHKALSSSSASDIHNT